MQEKIQLLDCTLRDGAYIVNGEFGTPAIRGIIRRMQDANVELVECGWLKDPRHKEGTTFYHLPSDLEPYLSGKNSHTTYVAMIDWDRYDLENLPYYDGNSVDAIRVVFPKDHFKEGIALADQIKEKGYQVYLQAANTLGYNEEELVALAREVNEAHPVALSVVDTFGAMYWDDLDRIVTVLDEYLSPEIRLGFHSHNNQQLSFALTMQFIEKLTKLGRNVIVDSSLCGMGRGAGNATTELVANYLNRKYNGNYDLDIIMDAIDMYMGYFTEHYSWGYSIPYFISGMYCAHVNNIAYLQKNHRTNARAMRHVIGALSKEDRKKYDYDLLEQKYLEYQNKTVDDEKVLKSLKEEIGDREVLLLLPGKSLTEQEGVIRGYIESSRPYIIGINAVFGQYPYDVLFFSNTVRYDYAKEVYPTLFYANQRIVASNIKTEAEENEMVVNFNHLIKRGWEHFDNSGMMCLRLLNKLHICRVAMAGFDGFEDAYSESYADISLPHINPGKKWEELNEEIRDMFQDFKKTTADYMTIRFITASKYDVTFD